MLQTTTDLRQNILGKVASDKYRFFLSSNISHRMLQCLNYINGITEKNNYSILFYPITLEGHRCTTDEFATIPFHLVLFSAVLVELAKSIPVHSLILSSHLFFCLPLFLFPFTVPCRIVFARPEDLETWPNHLSFRFLTRVRSLSYSPMAVWIFLRTSSLVTWSLYEMFNSIRYHLISKACVLFSISAVRVHDSQAYRHMEMTRERISFTFDPRDTLLSLQIEKQQYLTNVGSQNPVLGNSYRKYSDGWGGKEMHLSAPGKTG